MITTLPSISDPERAAAAFRLLVEPGGIAELRALNATVAGDRYPATYSGYFNDAEKLAPAVATFRTASGIYITPNPVDPALLARAANRIRKAPRGESTQDTHVIRRRWLLIDCDAQRPSGISATDAEHEAAIERCRAIYAYLRERGWPEPVAGDSGNGGHLPYRIDLPADDGGLVKRCLEALAERFDDDAVKVDTTVHNPARIWKLYGTRACKGDDTPDRPHRMARLLRVPSDLVPVPVESLETLAAETAPEEVVRPTSEGSHAFDLEGFIQRHLPNADGPRPWSGSAGKGEQWTLPLCPWDSTHDNGAAYIVRMASGAIAAGCHHNGCKGKGWAALRAKFEPAARASGKQREHRERESRVPPPPSPAWQPFPVDVLPKSMRQLVTVSAKAIGCDPSYVAVPLLAMLASCIGNARTIRLKRSWQEPCIVWAAVVGDSGTLKTPPFRAVMRPLREMQGKALKRHAEAMSMHEQELAEYERSLTAWKKSKGSEQPIKPDPPTCERYTVSDTTVEAVVPILLENPRGLLMARDELAGWFGSFDRYASGGSGADAAHWLSMHGGESLTVDRKTGQPRTIYVLRASVSVAGGIQPGILRRAMSEEHRESGLTARLLLAMPPRRAKRWTDADVPEGVERTLAALVERLLDLQLDTDDNGDPLPRPMDLTPTAKAAWIAFYNEHAEEHADLTGDLSAAWSKLEGYAARLALLLQLVADPDAAEVCEASIEAGIILTRWFGHEARRVYAMLAEDEDARDQRELLDLIERKGGSISGRELVQGSRRFQRVANAEAALDKLIDAGLGQWKQPAQAGRGGPRGRRFVYSVYVYGNATDDSATANTVDVDSVDGRESAASVDAPEREVVEL